MKKIWLALLMLFPIAVSACSCDNFNLSTYTTAVKNYANSTGFEYELTIVTKEEGKESYTKEISQNKYSLTTQGEVYDFSSKMTIYRIDAPSNGPEGAPVLVRSFNRYYVGNGNKFYMNEIIEPSIDIKQYQIISYEAKYNDINDAYNLKNLVPAFEKEQISDFQISKLSGKKSYSSAVFTAPVPGSVESDNELTMYRVTMNKDFYFDTIEFEVVNGKITTTYTYDFSNYNSKVVVEFPSNLSAYTLVD